MGGNLRPLETEVVPERAYLRCKLFAKHPGLSRGIKMPVCYLTFFVLSAPLLEICYSFEMASSL